VNNVYNNIHLAKVRQEELLTMAAILHNARRHRALSQASRRVERARKRLSQAQRRAQRLSRELESSWV
jgi:hypothetical protein